MKLDVVPDEDETQAERELEIADGAEGLPARFQVLKLPMPRKLTKDGHRLPATYANFYIGNKVVLLPAFADANDKWAAAILEKAFPDRTVVLIDCRELIWGLGAFHCLTQQQPAV